ncbi:MAG: hypothetical protein QW674_04785 [Candidatus Bathyarchaeia archaeon]
MGKEKVVLLKVAAGIKMRSLGLDVALCYRCGKLFLREKEELLCKDCKARASPPHSIKTC